MPLVCGILMSVTTPPHSAESSFFFAASPLETVSTLCPSLLRAISSIWQMERSSSTTSTLPTRPPSHRSHGRCADGLRVRRCSPQLQGELGSLAALRFHVDFAVVGLHDLV